MKIRNKPVADAAPLAQAKTLSFKLYISLSVTDRTKMEISENSGIILGAFPPLEITA